MLSRRKKADYIILNGAECEPYLTADHRLMLEQAERIITGLRYILKATDCQQGIIAVEENKLDVIKHLQEMLINDKQIRVQPLRVKYPQGSKSILFMPAQREVPGDCPLM